jgi:histidine ammonia-lyase
VPSPHVHGAVRDQAAFVAEVVGRELAAVTDNPIVAGTPEAPLVHAQAHAVGQAVALAMDALTMAVAERGAMAERRIDRLINPLVSGLPAFLTAKSGLCSGFMIPQYTAAALVAENRRLAQPASVEGGITSALHEDHLTHATPAAAKALTVIENVETILAIELLAACQAYDLQAADARRAAGTDRLYRAVRSAIPPYADDRPFAEDMARAVDLIRGMPIQGVET